MGSSKSFSFEWFLSKLTGFYTTKKSEHYNTKIQNLNILNLVGYDELQDSIMQINLKQNLRFDFNLQKYIVSTNDDTIRFDFLKYCLCHIIK